MSRGPLHGIPISIKDVFGVAGYRTYAGCPRALPQEFEAEGEIVRTLRRHGMVMMGKTHSVQFAFGALGVNSHHGTVRNPWDAEGHRVCGGSSTGAGVAVAEGSCILALGSDAGGSIRVPAAFTGTVGLKTTFGRWSCDGALPLTGHFDTAGFLARSVEDAAVGFSSVDVPSRDAAQWLGTLTDGSVRGLRLGMMDRFFWDDCSPGIAEGVASALAELEGAGACVLKLDLPEFEEAQAIFEECQFFGVESAAFLDRQLPEYLDSVDPLVTARLADARQVPATTYFAGLQKLATLSKSASNHLCAVDVLVSPTNAVTAPDLTALGDLHAYRAANMLAARNARIVNLLGLCAITMPVALDARGMPVGLQAISPAGADEQLIWACLLIERTLGTGLQRLGRPPLAAESAEERRTGRTLQ
jgi:aspartyl-tRNA(Asn)/glutamyl-tRNA(Gln) amidotransferase subunit A